MRCGTPIGCGIVAALGVTVVACRLGSRDDGRTQQVPQERSAADGGRAPRGAAPAPAAAPDAGASVDRTGAAALSGSTAGGERHSGADFVARSTEPDAAGGAAHVAATVAGASTAFDTGSTAATESGYGSHCREPPERTAAREGMRRMAEAHAQMTEQLRTLRTELEAQAAGLAEDLSLQRIPQIAADIAARVAGIPGARPVNADFIASLLREAAFWGALCRALGRGLAGCDPLDVGDSSEALYCRSAARLVWLARKRQARPSLVSVVGRAFGWSWDQIPDERTWQIVFHGWPETACARLGGSDPPDRWYGPICRALAARDVSRCGSLTDASHRRACAALVHALLGPGVAAGDAPTAAGEMLREYVAPSGTGSRCAASLPLVIAEMLDAAGVLEPGPLVLPDIERERGLAPMP